MEITTVRETTPFYTETFTASVNGINANIMVQAMKQKPESNWQWTPLDNDNLVVIEIPNSADWSAEKMEKLVRKHIVNTLVKLVSALKGE